MIFFRKTIPYILCWCLCSALVAQTSVVDSLEQALTSVKDDNSKTILLLDISNAYRIVDTAKSRRYIMEALMLAKQTGLERMEARAYSALGNYYWIAHQHYLAHVNYKEAERLCIKNNDKDYLYVVYYNMIALFNAINDYDNIIFYADKALEIASEQYDLTTLKPKYNLSDTSNLVDGRYNVITIIFSAQCFKEMARINNEGLDGLELYLEMFRKSILLNVDMFLSLSFALQCGASYIEQNRPCEALYYLHWVREDCETNPGRLKESVMTATYLALAEAYAMLNQIDSAEYFMKKVDEAPFISYENSVTKYRIHSMLHEKKGNYRSALESYKKFNHLSDSISKVGKSTEITRMRNWYELEQKDRENEILQQEKQKQQKLILILALALTMIIALFALSIFFYRKSVSKNRELKQLHGIKDKLFSVVAHDLRSPISTLVSILRLAEANMLDADMQTQFFKDISNQVDDTIGLLDNLLCWSKSQMQGIVPAPAYFDVKAASLEVTNTLQNIAANKNIILANRIEQQQIYADRDMLTLVVRNLTMNAIKYTSSGGEITLASELSGNKLVISVKDTGIGMPQEVQDNLFKLSETRSRYGTNNESGTGLGLVLCADFVKANGGNIWFTSKVGEGTTFYFSVPVNYPKMSIKHS